mmetsp:Transcript_29346/g.60162  ORF Transcript_29346/g.60162 Transcript_29346/m.60162 type:complete len:330 (-) Transcript_29346:12-1001(-)
MLLEHVLQERRGVREEVMQHSGPLRVPIHGARLVQTSLSREHQLLRHASALTRVLTRHTPAPFLHQRAHCCRELAPFPLGAPSAHLVDPRQVLGGQGLHLRSRALHHLPHPSLGKVRRLPPHVLNGLQEHAGLLSPLGPQLPFLWPRHTRVDPKSETLRLPALHSILRTAKLAASLSFLLPIFPRREPDTLLQSHAFHTRDRVAVGVTRHNLLTSVPSQERRIEFRIRNIEALLDALLPFETFLTNHHAQALARDPVLLSHPIQRLRAPRAELALRTPHLQTCHSLQQLCLRVAVKLSCLKAPCSTLEASPPVRCRVLLRLNLDQLLTS